MTSKKSLKILDVTIRDGSYLIDHQYTAQQIADIVEQLHLAGIENIEVSHGYGIGTHLMGVNVKADDEAILSLVKSKCPDLKIFLFISPNDIALNYLPKVAHFADTIRIGTNVHEIQKARPFIELAQKLKLKTSLQLVRSHARSPEFVAHQAKKVELWGCDIVYLVDSFGSMNPADVSEFILAMQAATQNISLGFHGHNNLGFANANALKAIELGVDWVDASLMGVGRGAGNTVLEELILQLQSQGLCENIKIKQLEDTRDNLLLPIFKQKPKASEFDKLCGQYKLDYAPEAKFLELCQQLNISVETAFKILKEDPEIVDINQTQINRLMQHRGQV